MRCVLFRRVEFIVCFKNLTFTLHLSTVWSIWRISLSSLPIEKAQLDPPGPHSNVFNVGSTVPDVCVVSITYFSFTDDFKRDEMEMPPWNCVSLSLPVLRHFPPTITTGAFERGRKVDYIQCAGGQTATVAAKALNLPHPCTTTASRPNNMPLYRRLAGVSGLYLIHDTLKGLNNWERPNTL